MRVHFREKYGTKGEEILYVTPAGNICLVILQSLLCNQHTEISLNIETMVRLVTFMSLI